MKKIMLYAIIIISILAGCVPGESAKMTRIDLKAGSANGNGYEEIMILDEQSLDAINRSFAKIKWEPNTKVQMARKEDFLATFFITEDKNMPERLIEYRIWFNNKSAEVISTNSEESYGKLEGDALKDVKKEMLEELYISLD